jgi:ubiquinone/menaquinone biosynthesis C-methylase UbiE
MSNETTTASVPARTESRWQVLAAHTYDAFLTLGEHRGMSERRSALLVSARGTVLEIGAGTGANLGAYPPVDRLLLAEPAPTMRRHLARRVARQASAAVVLDAGAEALPLPTGSVDTVVSTMVLCTVPDMDAALAEIVRVLRVDGQLLFMEHVAAPADSALRRWQERLAEPWATFAMGCRCNRDLVGAVSGYLSLDHVQTAAWRGMPPVVRPLVMGVATKPGALHSG